MIFWYTRDASTRPLLLDVTVSRPCFIFRFFFFIIVIFSADHLTDSVGLGKRGFARFWSNLATYIYIYVVFRRVHVFVVYSLGIPETNLSGLNTRIARSVRRSMFAADGICVIHLWQQHF